MLANVIYVTETAMISRLSGISAFHLFLFLKTKIVYNLGIYDFLIALVRILAFLLWVFSDSIWKDCHFKLSILASKYIICSLNIMASP